PGNPESDPTSPGEADFLIRNQKRAGSSATIGGTIGGNALIQLTAASASTAGLLDAEIDNFNGGHIGGAATVGIETTGNVTANSLFAQIVNTGGTIVGNAIIDMNISGTAMVTNDATVAIYGSDGAASAAINFNGGSYDAGG